MITIHFIKEIAINKLISEDRIQSVDFYLNRLIIWLYINVLLTHALYLRDKILFKLKQ